MKYIKSLSLILLFAIILSGCSPVVDKLMENSVKTFEIPSYGLSFTADGDFEEAESGGGWNIQITDGAAYFSIMAYEYADLSEGQTPEDVYRYHNEDIFSRRENVTVVTEEKGEIWNEITYLNTVYSAEKDGVKNYYSSYLVDMEQDGIFAWVLVTSTPSYLEKNSEEFKEMVRSIKYVSNTAN